MKELHRAVNYLFVLFLSVNILIIFTDYKKLKKETSRNYCHLVEKQRFGWLDNNLFSENLKIHHLGLIFFFLP